MMMKTIGPIWLIYVGWNFPDTEKLNLCRVFPSSAKYFVSNDDAMIASAKLSIVVVEEVSTLDDEEED